MDTKQETPVATSGGLNVYAALAGTTAWAAQAREALRLARERGLHLDLGALAWGDVRDLQALAGELRRVPIPRARVPRAARHLRPYLVVCGPTGA